MYQRLEVIGNVGKEPEVREVGDIHDNKKY